MAWPSDVEKPERAVSSPCPRLTIQISNTKKQLSKLKRTFMQRRGLRDRDGAQAWWSREKKWIRDHEHDVGMKKYIERQTLANLISFVRHHGEVTVYTDGRDQRYLY